MAPVTAILLQANTLELMGPRATAATRGTKRSGQMTRMTAGGDNWGNYSVTNKVESNTRHRCGWGANFANNFLIIDFRVLECIDHL